MIHGVFTPDREAIIPVVVRGPQGSPVEIEATIDTGFNDFLTLSPTLISRLGMQFAAPTQVTLADGRVVAMNYFHGSIVWDSEPCDILILTSEGGALVGMSMLYGFDLHIEAVDRGVVTIRRHA